MTGNVKVEVNGYYPSGQWEVLYSSITNDGSESWIVSGTAGSEKRIRVTSVNNPAITDISNSNLTFTTPQTISQIQWSGYTWNVKSGNGLKPDPNNWLANSSSVWVDGNGDLHLKIRKIGNVWYCAEIFSQQSLGYGEYTFQVSTNVENLDKNIVLGLFTYENDSKEIDLEFTRWSNASNPVGWYVVQPSSPSSSKNFALNLTGSYSTHKFNWSLSEINFQSYHGHSVDYLINQWSYKGANNPLAGNEKVILNLWLNNGEAPSNQQEAEVIIKSFTFKKVEASVGILSVRPEKLEYLPGQTVVFIGSLLTSTGQPIPYTQVNVDDPLVAWCSSSTTDINGNFRYESLAPNRASGIYGYTFYNGSGGLDQYGIISIKKDGGLNLACNAETINLGSTDNITDIDLVSTKKIANKKIPNPSNEELFNKIDLILNEVGETFTNSLREFVSNPINDIAILSAANCTVTALETTGGPGLVACSPLYLWLVKSYGKTLAFSIFTQVVDHSSFLGDEEKQYWKEMGKPGAKCIIGLMKFNLTDAVTDILSSNSTVWTCGTALVNTVQIGYKKILKAKALPSSSSSDKDAVGIFIIPLDPQVSSPTVSGITWNVGSSHTISWTGFTGSYVKIELYKGTTLNAIISSSTPNDGSFSWTVPANQSSGADYKIRITSTSDATEADNSDNNFTITSPSSTLTVTPTILTLGAAFNSNGQINISSNVSWTVSDDATWISVYPISGSNNQLITVTATSENTFTNSRSGSVTISGGGITRTVSVTQNSAMSTPTITTSASSLNFGNQLVNTTSSSQYYTISGSNLSSLISVSPPSGFQISQDNSSWQTAPIILNQTGGSIFVRFAPISVTSYSGNISHTSNGATPKDVSVSGTGSIQTSTFTISGYVNHSNGTPISNVMMSGFPTTTSTDGNGYYSYTVNSGWSGTIIPTKNGYSFYPTSQSYSNVTYNTTQNYIGTVQTTTFSISGYVYTSNGSGISGVMMNGFPNTTSTDANGFYTASISSGWSGTIAPTKSGYTFSPGNQSYYSVSSNQTKDYTGTVQTTAQTIFYGNSALTWTVTAPGTGYVVGTNSYGDIGKYQRFDITGSGYLNQAKIYFAVKQINGAADNFNLVVRSYGTGGTPGNLIYSQSYSTNIIEVSNRGTSYISFIINPQIIVNEKFFIGIEWAGSINDQFAIYADADGEGESQNRAWEKWSDGTFHDMFTSWNNFDVDLWIASVFTVLTDVKKDENVIPSDYVLYQNYPNPFNPTTNIEYSIPHSGFVSIKVYDVLGKEITTLINEEMRPGNYKVKFDGSKLTSGVYFYQLRAGIFSQIQKFLLIK
ncbi:MAG: T9SS type A sorting domain-containing protein [Melioribacteraceae bacterium]